MKTQNIRKIKYHLEQVSKFLKSKTLKSNKLTRNTKRERLIKLRDAYYGKHSK